MQGNYKYTFPEGSCACFKTAKTTEGLAVP